MFTRVLIANRGEIAVRVIRACREMGIEAVAVYSDADARAPHVALADHAVRLGPPPPRESYLSIERVIAAAQETGADAVHPGYGFLAENPALATACGAAGITFVGPPAAAMRLMGSKVRARQVAVDAGVAVVPGGVPVDQGDNAIVAAAMRTGLPVLIKPTEGGGGIGMKAVHDATALPEAVAQARREALTAFGDGTLYVERLIERPRHVEVQILADRAGACVHLGERECSIQRRHQKVIEESPSPAVHPELRERMGAAALAITRAAGYENAGTVEFLLDGAGAGAAFYFLEMNARLQVEHPVTEMVAGVDLVQAQILVAGGAALPWRQDQLVLRGHAIELRIYAEDPVHEHLPQAGRLLLYREPRMPSVRVDSGVAEGDTVGVHYDPLLAKLIAWGESREMARRRAMAALRDFPILGIRTNAPLLLEVLAHPRFVTATIDTGFLDAERGALLGRLTAEPPALVEHVAAAARGAAVATPAHAGAMETDPWVTLRGRRF